MNPVKYDFEGTIQRPEPEIDGPVVEINVGQIELSTTFYVHQKVLESASSFFRKALASNFKEAQTKVFNLFDEQTSVFRIFSKWIYGQQLEKLIPLNKDFPNFLIICKLYIFGDKRGIPSLQNHSICLLQRYLYEAWKPVPSGSINIVYQNTVESSKLRKFLVEEFVQTGPMNCLIDEDSGLFSHPIEFVNEVWSRMCQLHKERKSMFTGGQKWHHTVDMKEYMEHTT